MKKAETHYNLYMARKEKRILQKDVAKILAINPVTYHRKETGKADFTLQEAIKLADFFAMSLDDLFRPISK